MGVMSHLFHEYGPDRGEIAARKNGSLVSMEDGEATAYALNMIQERGRLMVEPGDAIYDGMIVGENARENDIPVNPCKAKETDQHAFAGRRQRHPARTRRSRLSLERALEYIGAGRIRGGHAEEPAAAEEDPRRKPAQTRRSKTDAPKSRRVSRDPPLDSLQENARLPTPWSAGRQNSVAIRC